MLDPDLLAWFDENPITPLDLQDAGPVQDFAGVQVRDVSLTAHDGSRAPCYLVEPPAAISPPFAGAVWLHWLEPQAFDSDRRQFLPEAIELAQQGVVSLLPDAFWATDPDRWKARGRMWRTEYAHDRDLVIRQVQALRRTLRLLTERSDIDAGRLAFIGHDFGAMCGALLLALEAGRFKGAALMAGTYSFGEWFVFGCKEGEDFKAAYREQIAVLDPARFLAQAGPVELLFQFATDDFYVSEGAARRFYAHSPESRVVQWYEAAHDLQDSEMLARVDRLAWLRTLLKLGS